MIQSVMFGSVTVDLTQFFPLAYTHSQRSGATKAFIQAVCNPDNLEKSSCLY